MRAAENNHEVFCFFLLTLKGCHSVYMCNFRPDLYLTFLFTLLSWTFLIL